MIDGASFVLGLFIGSIAACLFVVALMRFLSRPVGFRIKPRQFNLWGGEE